MRRIRKTLGCTALIVIVVQLVLVFTGIVDFASAARFVIIMELCLAGFVAFEIYVVVKAVRSARGAGRDVPFALDSALEEFLPAAVARYVRQDLMLIRAIAMLFTGRRDVRGDEEPMGYSSSLVVMLACIAVLDGIAVFLLHLLLPPGLRLIALILGLLGFVWLIGFIASLICYPHVVSTERLRLRFGAFHDVIIPVSAIESVRAVSGEPESTRSATRIDERLVMAVTGQVNMVIQTTDIQELTTLHPRLAGEPLSQITFYVDERRRAQELLERAIA